MSTDDLVTAVSAFFEGARDGVGQSLVLAFVFGLIAALLAFLPLVGLTAQQALSLHLGSVGAVAVVLFRYRGLVPNGWILGWVGFAVVLFVLLPPFDLIDPVVALSIGLGTFGGMAMLRAQLLRARPFETRLDWEVQRRLANMSRTDRAAMKETLAAYDDIIRLGSSDARDGQEMERFK